MTNKHVNNGCMKCIYSITLPFDLEDCAHILFTVIDFAGKGQHVISMLHDQYLGNIWYCPLLCNTYSIKRNGNILRKRLEEQYIQHTIMTQNAYHQIFIIPYLFCINLTDVHHICLMSKM